MQAVERDRFDYDTYWNILEKLRVTHRLLRFADVKHGMPETPFALLRHDVDYSPVAALELAQREAARGVRATYFLLLNGIYYNLLDPRWAHVPASLVELGHEVGLHYDVNMLRRFSEERWPDLIQLQAQVLERLSGQPIVSIAMHQPGLNGADPLRHRTAYLNAYDDRFCRDICYLSDSARAWRDETWQLLSEGPLPPRLQLALHPINWSARDRPRRDIFAAIHTALADDVLEAGRVLMDQIERHSGVLEHKSSLERDGLQPSAQQARTTRAAKAVSVEQEIFETIRGLWSVDSLHPLASILPRDRETLVAFYPKLQELVSSAPRSIAGRIDPHAIVQGDVIALGKGSVIEAGAIVHSSCRLIVGNDSVIRAGAVLRDEVVIGDRCVVGVNCEVVRSVLLGPETHLGHFIFLGDSIVGRDALLSGNVWVSNTTTARGGKIHLYLRGQKIDSGRSHLGLLMGDGARIGASTMICAGCIVLPQLTLPPSTTLHGTIDGRRRRRLMKQFFNTWADSR